MVTFSAFFLHKNCRSILEMYLLLLHQSVTFQLAAFLQAATLILAPSPSHLALERSIHDNVTTSAKETSVDVIEW